jgi:hypothetical protein
MPPIPDKNSPHEDCGAYVKAYFDANDVEVTVSTLPPIVPNEYEDLGLSCPHGVRFYAEPTGDQIATWIRNGVQ